MTTAPPLGPTLGPTLGPGRRTLRRHTRRAVLTCLVVLMLSAGLAVGALASGRYATPLADLWPVLTGGGDPGLRFVLLELRLPRIGTALTVGAALGGAGALFQSASRNPLGSPDIVGFTVGAATGALVVLLVLDGTSLTPAVGTALGGAAVAATALLLGGTGQRLILVGIGLSALLTSVNAYLLTRAEVTDAQNAAVWLVGSLNGSGAHLPLLLGALTVLLPLAVVVARGCDSSRPATRRRSVSAYPSAGNASPRRPWRSRSPPSVSPVPDRSASSRWPPRTWPAGSPGSPLRW
ncbi:hypothetical protein Jiend_13340 [Micromonospora endophytica]|nr:hypothetical protein Jiend_13340 [Micromonospora endophytica]